jgi:predicted nucleic acid-binding protein
MKIVIDTNVIFSALINRSIIENHRPVFSNGLEKWL